MLVLQKFIHGCLAIESPVAALLEAALFKLVVDYRPVVDPDRSCIHLAATRNDRSTSRVQMEADNPYLLSLARRTASASARRIKVQSPTLSRESEPRHSRLANNPDAPIGLCKCVTSVTTSNERTP